MTFFPTSKESSTQQPLSSKKVNVPCGYRIREVLVAYFKDLILFCVVIVLTNDRNHLFSYSGAESSPFWSKDRNLCTPEAQSKLAITYILPLDYKPPGLSLPALFVPQFVLSSSRAWGSPHSASELPHKAPGLQRCFQAPILTSQTSWRPENKPELFITSSHWKTITPSMQLARVWNKIEKKNTRVKL